MTVAFPLDKLPQGHSRGANQSGKARSLSSQTLGEVESPLHRYLEKHPRDDDVFWCPSGDQKQSNWIRMKCCVSIEGKIQADRRGKSKSGKKQKTLLIKKGNGWTSWWPKPAPQVEVFITWIGPNLAACKQFWPVESKARNGQYMKVNLAGCLKSASGHWLLPPLAAAHPFFVASLLSMPRIRSLACVGVGSSLGAWLHHTHLRHSSAQQFGELSPVWKGGGWRMTTANRSAYQCTETINLPRSQLQTLTLTAYYLQVKQSPAKSIANLRDARYISCFHFAQNLAQISFL